MTNWLYQTLVHPEMDQQTGDRWAAYYAVLETQRQLESAHTEAYEAGYQDGLRLVQMLNRRRSEQASAFSPTASIARLFRANRTVPGCQTEPSHHPPGVEVTRENSLVAVSLYNGAQRLWITVREDDQVRRRILDKARRNVCLSAASWGKLWRPARVQVTGVKVEITLQTHPGSWRLSI